uniref:Uncharacterized protein n=1 Tax=Solibacter usitatus (strain Ellin6076) TaxID=234267 RepID=Q01RK9_SOLUE
MGLGKTKRIKPAREPVSPCPVRPAVSLMLLFALNALAWVYPEHRDITLLALQGLDPAQRALLETLWSQARTGHEARLCAQMAYTAQGAQPTCIDYAAWPAISGDHSCSARDMLGIVLDSRWILRVARVGARLKNQLAAATRRDQRTNAVRDSDLALVRADRGYLARSTANNAHFPIARSNVTMDLPSYVQLALRPESELNALVIYMWYHLRALAKARSIASASLPPERYAQAARATLADEAFALHFLQDGFAAGHFAGTWGNAAVRKGTHDYYNEHGLEAVSWDNRRRVALGDANMQPGDADRAATAVRDSLAQLASALDDKTGATVAADFKMPEPEGFNVCRESHFPAAVGELPEILAVEPIIAQTPIPALGAGKGALPRFRSEIGPFIGLSSALRGTALGGGFASTQSGVGTTGGLEAAVRLGLGLEGVLSESSDGQVFIDLGFREDSSEQGGASIPGRSAFVLRWRVPFWLIPGDLIVATPVLAFTNPRKLKKMAMQSANGGLIPWQTGIATRIGRFQFMLGREIGLSFYGYASDQNVVIPTPGAAPVNQTIVKLRSIGLDVPILEWRIFHMFSLDQSSGLGIQFYTGFDRPTSSSVVAPAGAPKPSLHTIVTGGVRVVFDWRHYRP